MEKIKWVYKDYSKYLKVFYKTFISSDYKNGEQILLESEEYKEEGRKEGGGKGRKEGKTEK